MGTSVTNRLIIGGNEKVHNFVKALNEQFIEDYKINGFQNDSSVRRIIYGHSPEIAEQISKSQDRKSIHFMDDTKWYPIESTISFLSRGGDAEELQDYLLAILSRLDPWVLVCNQHSTEYLSSISTRYLLMSDLAPEEIKTYIEVKVPNVETDAFFKRFENLVIKERKKAFKLVKEKFNWITDNMYR